MSGSCSWQDDSPEKARKVGQRMEKAAKGVTPEIITEEILAEAKDEVKEAPSRIRKKLRQLTASDVVDSSLAGMYGAKFQALAKEHEQVYSDKG
jgi:hypothetical protein